VATIGFIGLGTMGRPMAERLIEAGHKLQINRVKAQSQYLVDKGAQAVDTPAAAARGADIVILMVPDTQDVEAVLFGPSGAASGLSAKSLLIDMSSIAPVATRDFAARVHKLGAHYLDAPVSGGEVGAKGGTLTIMVGGEAADFERARPIFEVLGKTITHVGPVGCGQVVKVANQIIVGLTIECVGEAFLLAERAGVDLATLKTALMGGFAQSRILELHGQRMIEETFDPGFALKLHRKDLNIALETARNLDIALPNTAATVQLMNSAVSRGLGGKDHSVLFRALGDISPDAQA
jgi:2-hydroxy-3-oxopropionate reductase